MHPTATSVRTAAGELSSPVVGTTPEPFVPEAPPGLTGENGLTGPPFLVH